MTNQHDFRVYHRLKRRLEKEINDTEDEHYYKRLQDLYRRNFPTKEQAIEEVQAFLDAEGGQGLMSEPCVEHHWDEPIGHKRCRYCQMKYSYWLDVEEAIDRGNVKAEDWSCKSHYHKEAEG